MSKPPSTPESSWEALTSRIVLDTQPCGDGAPYGFATRIVSQWRAARRDEALRRWSLWSLRATLCAIGTCAWIVMFQSPDRDAPILIAPPTPDFLKVPLSS
jgi:hypothetical protein